MKQDRAITYADVADAANRVQPVLRRTPCLDVVVPTPTGPQGVTLKLESLQVTGSFKPRGATNSLMLLDADHVIACSGGNHGLAVAWAARELGRHATVVVPSSTARAKVDAMLRLDAEVIEHGDTPGEAFSYADELVAESGRPLLHPYDQVPTVAGQGTLGLEVVQQAPDVTHWMVAVGGGGLLSGIVVALQGSSEVVPVEPEGCPTLSLAQLAGRPVPSPASGIARTSLGAPSIGAVAWSVLSCLESSSVLVSDDAIVNAQTWLWEQARVLVEPGGAAAIAALQCGAWEPPAEARVGVLVCGGNTDSIPPPSP